jgi:ribosomal protein S18 acetylase RimI-like enzyme
MVDESPHLRRCDTQGIPAAVDLLVEAFYEDPTWSWVFEDPGQRRPLLKLLWGAIVTGVSAYSTVWFNAASTAVAVWVPPDGIEIPEPAEAQLTAAISDILGARAVRALDAMEAFDTAHPHHEPHWTLSLLGTSVEHRGQGLGLGLLRDTLRRVDAEGMPAYLEASNPVNVGLYQRYGFERFGSFTIPNGGPDVTTMWRPAR